jgi:predicted RecB family nuclease
MKITTSGPSFAATDLSAFSDCRHLTLLSLAVAEKKLQRPGVSEIETKLLEKRGHEHEKRVLDLFRQEQRNIVEIVPGSNASDDTMRAMRDGADIIYQGVLLHRDWTGRPDFLVKSGSGAYEPWDAKLSRIAKSAGVLQLCSYADSLAHIFGIAPKEMRLILGGPMPTTEILRADDYMAYFRRAKGELEEFLRDPSRTEPYPEPVPHCNVCVWWKRCADRRRDDDHLSLVANSSRVLRERVVNNAVRTVRDLASMAPSLSVPGIADVPLARLREQARIQVAGRDAGKVLHELLTDFEPGTGLEALPEPRPGDLFFDLEGDSFFDWGSGLEYLFGLLELGQPDANSFVERVEPGDPKYLRWWATNRVEEKAAFEEVIDRIAAGRTEFPDLHVFHYGHRGRRCEATLVLSQDERAHRRRPFAGGRLRRPSSRCASFAPRVGGELLVEAT